jgi:toxin ParE1/3/4
LPDFRLHPLAAADLDSIIYYTTLNWGEDQARLYGQQLMQAVADFVQGDKLGKSISPKMPGIKLLRSEHHYICVVEQKSGRALVLAILHERMDIMPRIRKRLQEIGV